MASKIVVTPSTGHLRLPRHWEIKRHQKPLFYCVSLKLSTLTRQRHEIALRGLETMVEPAVVVSYRNAHGRPREFSSCDGNDHSKWFLKRRLCSNACGPGPYFRHRLPAKAEQENRWTNTSQSNHGNVACADKGPKAALLRTSDLRAGILNDMASDGPLYRQVDKARFLWRLIIVLTSMKRYGGGASAESGDKRGQERVS